MMHGKSVFFSFFHPNTIKRNKIENKGFPVPEEKEKLTKKRPITKRFN